jgi:LAO/AO transport system kinase
MESVALDDGVYIRSMGSRGSVGGLATTTREVCDLLDAANFDRILVETVGVGQSELDVAGMTDSTVLVLVPESGDGIQTLKSGIIEIADLFVVNKADRPGAEQLRRELEVTLGLRRRRGARSDGRAAGRAGGQADAVLWKHPVMLTVATKGDGVPELIAALDRHHAWLVESGTLKERRTRRLLDRTREVVDRATRRWVWEEARADQRIAERLDEIAAGRVSPYEVAAEVLDGLKQGERT